MFSKLYALTGTQAQTPFNECQSMFNLQVRPISSAASFDLFQRFVPVRPRQTHAYTWAYTIRLERDIW